METKDLKITAGYIVTESKLSKPAKLQLLNFIQHEASDEQLMVLMLDGKITKLDEQAKEIVRERFKNSTLLEIGTNVPGGGLILNPTEVKDIKTALWVGGAVLGLYIISTYINTIQFLIAAKECKQYSVNSPAYKACSKKVKIENTKRKLQQLQKSIKLCDKAKKNPDKCKQKIQDKIKELQNKIKKYELEYKYALAKAKSKGHASI